MSSNDKCCDWNDAPSTALDILSQMVEKENRLFVSTASSSLDALLGGGLQPEYVTELTGEASSGKTQICFQACVTAQLPTYVGGLQAEVVYIDTELSFQSQRIAQMVESLKIDYEESCSADQPCLNDFSTELVISGIHYRKALNCEDLADAITKLDSFINQYPKVKLIIIDSIAAPVREEFDNLAERDAYLSHIGAKLTRLAATRNAVVIVTNQVTSQSSNASEGSQKAVWQTVPALGPVWASVPANRLIIGRGPSPDNPIQQYHLGGEETSLENAYAISIMQQRWAKLVKTSDPVTKNWCSFQVLPQGIRDLIIANSPIDD